MVYAGNTQVSVARSKAEIEDMIIRYGGNEFASGYDGQQAKIMFRLNERIILFRLPLPSKESFSTRKDRWGYDKEVSADVQIKNWKQACRSKWRALVLCIRAKLESASSGITTFEEEFLAHFVMKDGETIGQKVIPQLDNSLKKDNLMLGM